MFYVELKAKSNNKDMYEVGSLLDCRVKFETSYSKREIPESALTARGTEILRVFAFVGPDASNA